jgi:hypothetical protein
MNQEFDELTKRLAQLVTQAPSKFSGALASLALAGVVSLPANAQVSHLGPLVELSQPNPVAAAPPTDAANWGNEVRLTDHSFDLEKCVILGTETFLGAYIGNLVGSGNGFVVTFTPWTRTISPASSPDGWGRKERESVWSLERGETLTRIRG